MDDERRKLHERISESFEAKPEAGGSRWWAGTSPLGYWRVEYNKQAEPTLFWACPNFDTDEAANARLLEAMPAAELVHAGGLDWLCYPNYGSSSHRGSNKDRKRAIVDAYCRWKKLMTPLAAGGWRLDDG